MTRTSTRLSCTALVALGVTLIVAGCGGGSGNSTQAAPSAGNGVDRAFVAEMIPHHKMAIEMARVAKTDAEHAQIKRLAGDIISAQQSEITRLQSTDAKLAAAGIKPGTLGVAASKSGMSMSMSVADLHKANPFDRSFIDMMVPHHQGAITMAQAELAKGKNASLKAMASQIISAQRGEVGEMKKWRKSWYGSDHSDMKMGG